MSNLKKAEYDKIYREKNSEVIRLRNKLYYINNKSKIDKYNKEYTKKNYLKIERNEKRLYNHNIRTKTSYYFPIENITCDFCENKAKEHHHYTTPIKYNKFYYVCKYHHKLIHEVEKHAKLGRM